MGGRGEGGAGRGGVGGWCVNTGSSKVFFCPCPGLSLSFRAPPPPPLPPLRLFRLAPPFFLFMKVRTAVKRICDTCRIVLRRGRVYVVCKANPKVRGRGGRDDDEKRGQVGGGGRRGRPTAPPTQFTPLNPRTPPLPSSHSTSSGKACTPWRAARAGRLRLWRRRQDLFGAFYFFSRARAVAPLAGCVPLCSHAPPPLPLSPPQCI